MSGPPATGVLPLSRILVVNDDGIDADGLRVAEELAALFAEEVWVVAPQIDQSGMSHAFSLNLPIRVIEQGPRRFAVAGTPSDCIAMAMKSIMVGQLPDLVISGVNAGTNLADDITYSGTVSGATTAALCGVPAVAFSQAYRSDEPISWDTARQFGARTLARLLTAPLPGRNVPQRHFSGRAARRRHGDSRDAPGAAVDPFDRCRCTRGFARAALLLA